MSLGWDRSKPASDPTGLHKTEAESGLLGFDPLQNRREIPRAIALTLMI